MALDVATIDSAIDVASIDAVLNARRWGPTIKDVGAEDHFNFKERPQFVDRIAWSRSPTTSSSRPRVVTSVVNRYYDPATDQYLSIDPDVADTNQPYVFTNDDPLNTTDPLGECWFACGVWHDVTSTADHVGNFVKSNVVTFAGLTIDGVSVGFDVAGAVTGDSAFGFVGSAFGYAGAVVSAIGCKDKSQLACIGIGIGAGSATAGLIEGVLESGTGESATTSLLRGIGLNLGAASATLDAASLVVAIDKAISSSAKKVAKKVTKSR